MANKGEGELPTESIPSTVKKNNEKKKTTIIRGIGASGSGGVGANGSAVVGGRGSAGPSSVALAMVLAMVLALAVAAGGSISARSLIHRVQSAECLL